MRFLHERSGQPVSLDEIWDLVANPHPFVRDIVEHRLGDLHEFVTAIRGRPSTLNASRSLPRPGLRGQSAGDEQ
jgi:hypothetical protein